MKEWLNNIPLFWAQVIAVITFISVIIWTWFRPKKYIYKDAPSQKTLERFKSLGYNIYVFSNSCLFVFWLSLG